MVTLERSSLEAAAVYSVAACPVLDLLRPGRLCPHSPAIHPPFSDYSQPVTDRCLAQARGPVIKTHLLPL